MGLSAVVLTAADRDDFSGRTVMASDRGVPDGDKRSRTDLRGKVRAELDRLRELAKKVSPEEVRQGEWFARLLRFSMDPYVQEVDAAYFDQLYPALSAEQRVRARIELAARYASVEGALTAGAYTGAVAAAFGSRGAALPVALPSAGASFVLDLLFMSSLQLRLGYDVALILGVPLDLEDPEDLWRLIQVAFVIHERPSRWQALGREMPRVVRTTIEKMFTGEPGAATRSMPALGKFLLQRHVVKFAIPGVGVPLSIGVNYWSANAAGSQASSVFRREARIMETARHITDKAVDHAELLWVLWLIVRADSVVHENERLLLKHVSALVGDLNTELSALTNLDSTIDFDQRPTASIPDFKSQDKEALYQAGVAAAAVDGSVDANELSRLKKVAEHCSVPFDAAAVRRLAAAEARAS
jgi:tellurite resistance protein